MTDNVKHFQIYLIFLCVLAFFSCKPGNRPDVNHINLDVKIERFDKDLFAGKQKNPEQTHLFLQKKYASFYDDYIKRMVGRPD